MYLQLSDEELVGLLKVDDHLALENLFNRYYKSLCQLSAVYTKDFEIAEEVVANMFMKLWDTRNDLNLQNVKGYLSVSIRNASINQLQRKKLVVEPIDEVAHQLSNIADELTPLNIITGRESYNRILKLIDTLPTSQREVLLMSHVDNLSKHEIAAILDISVRTVETTLYQSVKKLRLLLKDSYNSAASN
ncbi:sigma-70 family RNA polymerase sigma factor [uncultured Mucilaginibacter sp.]|uniref:RNA polymerase sigma factor n=1 Tax=uncultured Mucilaginibacter sp. TaxID=797541 RepID=UPI0025FF06DB|nr:sigma-70 family RNA polymerase sigma factor [uncultured Mucilaginibacter sp.]